MSRTENLLRRALLELTGACMQGAWRNTGPDVVITMTQRDWERLQAARRAGVLALDGFTPEQEAYRAAEAALQEAADARTRAIIARDEVESLLTERG